MTQPANPRRLPTDSSITEMLSRRHWLGSVAAAAWLAGHLEAQDPAERLTPLNRFPRMLQEYYVARLRQIETRGQRRRAKLKTADDVQAYLKDVRGRIGRCFGPWPEKTPLKARSTGTLERDGYRVEKILFESRPGLIVTANLYLPDADQPVPGVIGTCGHSANGKAAEAYQGFAQGLARQGTAVLIYDPIGQGERLQYPDPQLGSRIGTGVREHLQAGNQQYLVGEFFGAWRAWDGIRALDYLLTRPEVDREHIGVTGNSGGGTMTTWLCGVESRWTMAAPACFVTSFRRNLENELPADTEQCPPRALALGLDHLDFLAAMAPKPVIILAKEEDYFDVRGSEYAYRELKHLYTLLGQPDNVALFVGPGGHGYSQENREAMYAWFNRHSSAAAGGREPELTFEKDEDLYAAPDGQVTRLDSRTVMDFTRERAEHLKKQRAAADPAALPERVVRVLGLTPAARGRRPIPDYRIARAIRGRQWKLPYGSMYLVESEPGIQAVVYRLDDRAHYSRPVATTPVARLLVSHLSADDELRNHQLARTWSQAKPPGYVVDLRGIGESRPDTTNANSFHSPYGSDYFYAAHGIMLHQPVVGQRTWDLLRVVDWLAGCGYESVDILALGWGAVPAVLAAVLDSRIQVKCSPADLPSFHELAVDPMYKRPLSGLIPGVLQQFDMDDCRHWLGKRWASIEST